MNALQTADVRMQICRSPFSAEQELFYFRPGGSISDYLRAAGWETRTHEYFSVCVNGTPLPREANHNPLNPGDIVTARFWPKDEGKPILTIITGIALIALGQYWAVPLGAGVLGPLTATQAFFQGISGYVITAGATLLTQGAFGLIAPLFTPAQRGLQTKEISSGPNLSAITGTRNRILQHQHVPHLFGRMRFFPPLIAQPWTENFGNQQFMYLLYGWKGDSLLSDVRIGDTPLHDYQGEYLHTYGAFDPNDTRYFINSTQQTNINLEVPDLDVLLFSAKEGAAEIVLDFSAPQGIGKLEPDLSFTEISVEIIIRYKSENQVAWDEQRLTMRGQSSRAQRESIRIPIEHPAERYQVEVTRGPISDDQRIIDRIHWDTLKSITRESPVKIGTVINTLQIKVPASPELSGIISAVSVLAERIYDVWDGNAFYPTTSRTPAWAYVEVLRQELEEDEIDLDYFLEWSQADEAAGRQFNYIQDTAETIYEILHKIATAGRATPTNVDGQYSIVRDIEQAVPRQLYTSRNSSAYEGQINLTEPPHALNVVFINEEEDYQPDERIVYQDGYTEENATKFETLPLIGNTHRDTAWKEGRYYLASMTHRREIHTFKSDLEHLLFNRGDLIEFARESALISLYSSRIIDDRMVDDGLGGMIRRLTMETDIELDDSKEYGMRVRLANNDHIRINIENRERPDLRLLFTLSDEGGDLTGALAAVGERTRETIPLIVKSIKAYDGNSALIIGIDAAQVVHQADRGEIPPWTPNITLKPNNKKFPDPPVIRATTSDETVARIATNGTIYPRIAVSLTFPEGVIQPSYLVEVSFWNILSPNSPESITQPITGPETTIYINDIREGDTIAIRARTLNPAESVASVWTPTINHVVVGLSTPPPVPDQFLVDRMSDGTRIFTWKFDKAPIDLHGVKIRYEDGLGHLWDNMRPLHEGVVTESPFQTNYPSEKGQFSFACKGIDRSGHLSLDTKYIYTTIDVPRRGDSLVEYYPHYEGWPGILENAWRSRAGILLPKDRKDWQSFIDEGTDWSEWRSWARDPYRTISYTYPTIDLAAVLDFSIRVTVFGIGVQTIVIQHSEDNNTFIELVAAPNETVRARYVKIKVTMEEQNVQRIPVIESVHIELLGKALESLISDLDTSTIGNGQPGDRRISPGKPFALITNVQVALQNVGPGWNSTVVDKQLLGPRIKIFNQAGDLADAVIDAVIKGIPQ